MWGDLTLWNMSLQLAVHSVLGGALCGEDITCWIFELIFGSRFQMPVMHLLCVEKYIAAMG